MTQEKPPIDLAAGLFVTPSLLTRLTQRGQVREPESFLIHTDADGNLQFIYEDSLQFLYEHGDVEIHRASDVDPDERGQWWVDLSKSGVDKKLGPFQTRSAALAAERKYLDEEVLGSCPTT